MNSRTTLPFLALTILLALATTARLEGDVNPQGPNLTVFVTGDQNGEVASCGCPKEDYGGLTRRAAFFDTLRASDWEFLALDVGDLTPFAGLDAQGELKIETMARGMGVLGYQAITLGDHDIAPGPEFVRKLVDWLGAPVLATNYRLPDGQSEPTRQVQVRDRSVGLVAFLDPGLVPDADWIGITPWADHRREVEDLAADSDVLVALVHAPDTSRVSDLARMYPEIDLIVAGHEGLLPGDLYTVGTTRVLGTAGRGRYVGRVEVAFDSTGAIQQMASAYLPVVAAWGRRPRIDVLLSDYYEGVRKLVQSDDFLEERREALEEPATAFVGNAACVTCHQAESDQWKTTLHSHAQETLVREGKDHDPECQPCHTTGYGFRTGFVTPESTPDLWNVGCESCHGGGAAHLAAPREPYGAIDETVCLHCHTEDNSPDFEYPVYQPQIVHTTTATPH